MPEFDQKDKVNLQKEIYIQTQNWARHNETLIIATNTVLLGAMAATAANFFKATSDYSSSIIWLPLLISMTGIVTTCYLSRQYKLAITRVVVYEHYFEMVVGNLDIVESARAVFEKSKQTDTAATPVNKSADALKEYPGWGSGFVPEYLNNPPKFGAASSWFFLIVHLIIFCSSVYKIWSG